MIKDSGCLSAVLFSQMDKKLLLNKRINKCKKQEISHS